MAGTDPGNERLRGDSFLLRLEHDRRAMGIVGTQVPTIMAEHFLCTNPDVGLNRFDDMPKMQRTIGIGQGGCNENSTRHV